MLNRFFILVAIVYTPIAAGQIIHESRKVTAADGTIFDQFGYSVAVSNEFIFIGAVYDVNGGSSSGSVYQYDTVSGDLIRKLLPDDGVVGDDFGCSIAIWGDKVLIGAESDNVNGINSGSVYIYDIVTGDQVMKLWPSDGAHHDRFGESVAVYDNTVIVGADGDDDNGSNSGSAYLFDLTTGQELHKLVPTDGTFNDRFGISVSVSSSTALIGAYRDSGTQTLSGSAYTFDIHTGQQLQKFLPDPESDTIHFGLSVAINDEVIVIGASNADGTSDQGPGEAYVFGPSAGQPLLRLMPEDSADNDAFGRALALHDGAVVITSIGVNTTPSAYMFDVETGEQLAVFRASGDLVSNGFGNSVAISNSWVCVGAPFDDENGQNSGSTYQFATSSTECNADTNGDSTLTPADFSAWVAAFNALAPECDQNDDGSCTPADFSAWVANYNAGC